MAICMWEDTTMIEEQTGKQSQEQSLELTTGQIESMQFVEVWLQQIINRDRETINVDQNYTEPSVEQKVMNIISSALGTSGHHGSIEWKRIRRWGPYAYFRYWAKDGNGKDRLKSKYLGSLKKLSRTA
jgi:hypothetical protein